MHRAAHKYLGLQQQLAFACLALHVVDRVSLLDICVKTEDHALSFTGPKKISPIVLIHRKKQSLLKLKNSESVP